MAEINVGKFINNLDSEDLTSEKLQGVVNNVYAKAIKDHKKTAKIADDNLKDQDKETVEFIKSNHDRLKGSKDRIAREINESVEDEIIKLENKKHSIAKRLDNLIAKNPAAEHTTKFKKLESEMESLAFEIEELKSKEVNEKKSVRRSSKNIGLKEDKVIARFQDDGDVHEIHDYENGEFANHYGVMDYKGTKVPTQSIAYFDSEEDAREMMKKHRPNAKEINLDEDTVKQGNKWVNKGEEGTHGKFRTKKAADAQRKAMFANGFKEELENTDGWGDTIPSMLETFFDKLEKFMYEVRNARRNSYARFGDNVEAIVSKLHEISEDADNLASEIDMNENMLNESRTELVKEDEMLIYQFHELDKDDIKYAIKTYGLKNVSDDYRSDESAETDIWLMGPFYNLYDFAEDYLGYHLVDGYLVDKFLNKIDLTEDGKLLDPTQEEWEDEYGALTGEDDDLYESTVNEDLIGYDPKNWDPDMIELHKSIDWKARNYEDYQVPNTEIIDLAYLYGNGKVDKVNTTYVLTLMANPIYPPVYRTKEFQPFDGYTDGMYDGHKIGKYNVHDRFETWDLYNLMFN